MAPVDRMGQLVPDAPEELCQALDAIFEALERVPPSWAEYADEHVRWETYKEAVAALEAGRLDVQSITDCLRIDPDRLMASGAAGLLLVPKQPRGERELVLASMSDWKWVRERFDELAIFDRLVRSDADDPSELRDVSGWLEEELARCSESAAVLNYLMTSFVAGPATTPANDYGNSPASPVRSKPLSNPGDYRAATAARRTSVAGSLMTLPNNGPRRDTVL